MAAVVDADVDASSAPMVSRVVDPSFRPMVLLFFQLGKYCHQSRLGVVAMMMMMTPLVLLTSEKGMVHWDREIIKLNRKQVGGANNSSDTTTSLTLHCLGRELGFVGTRRDDVLLLLFLLLSSRFGVEEGKI